MASPQQAGPQEDSGPVHRFKSLVPRLRESLQDLMGTAAASLVCAVPADSARRFDRSLEEFYSLCDQLEACLRLADQCICQSGDSTAHLPGLVRTATKTDAVRTADTSYAYYLASVKYRVSCIEEMRMALLECCKKVTGEGNV